MKTINRLLVSLFCRIFHPYDKEAYTTYEVAFFYIMVIMILYMGYMVVMLFGFYQQNEAIIASMN